ncbi:MAG: protoporphyrinogen oxidase [Proteobacteria bacterium]|nr:protoporphyrinogen oxidase [Pseudomonadota bacterium]MBU1648394.1 protoporphyrinogen oxidase [Pseudomonadota bacterium]MBU1986551.1 protoporphyrinogen oxidase [Pseudomonadota bacterium]
MDTLIIGGGLSGLTVAHKLQQLCPGQQTLILEKSGRAGGVIWSHAEDGFLAENGPHGFLDNCPESQLLLQETGLDQECVKAPLSKFVRYVCMNGDLRCIPQSPPKIIMAPLISPLAKLRVLAELFKKPLTGEPTVAEWVEHRFGPALLPYVDAVFTGTYAGDLNRLVIDGVMPGVRRLEMTHGSVLRGLIAKMKQARKDKTSKSGEKKGLPAMTSFPGGMGRLPERLAESLQAGRDILLNCGVLAIRKSHSGWVVESEQGSHEARNLVLALPINPSLGLLHTFTPRLPQNSVPEARIVTIAMGFGPGSTLPPGFGYLAPEQEKRFCLGALFSSNMFPARAPQDHILLEALVGGRRHPERLDLDDATLIRHALQDLRELLPLQGEPVYARVLRPKGGIPQLETGYPALLSWRDQLMQEHQGLFIHGFGWEGIGLNDMIKSASRVAESIKKNSGTAREEAAVKGIYF